jgi:site-specific DNA-methyltransferase (adenine-specific)
MLDIRNIDCMELMKQYEDNYFDLAIVDVPYTDNYDAMKQISVSNNAKAGDYHYNSLTNAKPKKEYWDELFRISKNQIIWGGNYFTDVLPVSDNWVVWKKMDIKSNFKPFELAWTSLDKSLFIDFLWAGMWQQNMKNKEKRIHPTQKPKQVYKTLLEQYAKPTDKILDTHLGSGSIAIACHYFGCDLVACEIDEHYYKEAMKRIKNETAQVVISFNH